MVRSLRCYATLTNLYKYRGGRRDTAATKVPIGPFSRFPHERTWRQPGKLYSARKSPGGRAAACWQNKGQGQGHGPPMPSLLRYGAVLELDGNRGLLISYPPYHMCINTVLGQIAGFESKLQVKVTSQMVIRVKISHLFMANLVNDKAMAAPSPI
ncbi:hypothetical protein MGG_17998 [Pyricularia oryzae 70-15]|uniref:Uncharacterized protein n=1 Tax=Pyricularia oryzae (strain 70-15 / ATCC MYA-4617 / FGSC 8958) TaxID=242507 RepID=G4NJD9_PYRO7|nr:uncharacterized protein MGG_17998 [Pyricularia oryzae 70-15]EHA46355.1 hypothetical protein MGG_17998 [Pyricularia oryzae 70-15]